MDKQLGCVTCSSRFVTKWELINHENSVHGERPTHVIGAGKGLLGDTVLLITSFLMLGTKHTRVCVGRCILMRLG